jgi:hypothetical protein
MQFAYQAASKRGETSQEVAAEDIPRLQREARAQMRKQLEHALTAARIHANCIRHNPLAVQRQEAVILTRELALAQFNSEEWLEI